MISYLIYVVYRFNRQYYIGVADGRTLYRYRYVLPTVECTVVGAGGSILYQQVEPTV